MNNTDITRRALRALPTMVTTLRTYVEIDSPTGDAAALGAFTRRLAVDFARIGAEVEVVPEPTGDHLMIRFAGTAGRENDAPLVFLAHSDTVWGRDTRTSMPWREEGDTAFGPGVFDMKGGIVAAHAALEIVQDTEAAHRPVVVVVTADEEIGSPTSRGLVERNATGAHGVFGLEPAHPDGALKTSRMGSTRVRLRVIGREAHAALDAADGVSAIDELVDQLLVVRRILDDHPEVLCNVGTVSGGGKTNVVAGSAHADIGLRFADTETENRVLDQLRSLTAGRDGATVDVALLSSRPAWPADARHDALRDAVAAAAAFVGQDITGRPASGAADTNISGSMGIPSIDGFGPLGSGAHAVHEQVHLPSLADRAALLAAIITRL